ncbi:MAG: TRAM domain-containing protein [Treponema sp.]|jgi:23S rRNA (uracil1939-C5)-methyltransferase|nr:TRAM domain-containing protein [Treponema sp.]
MAIGEVCTVQIEGIAAGGSGLARLEGQRLFIDKTAPGDTVRGRITEEHRGWARAELVEITGASPERITPACPRYGTCGGCSFQHLRYEAQIRAKTAILRDAFTRLGGLIPPEPLVFSSAPWEYRNRMQFHCIEQFHCIKQFHRIKQFHSVKDREAPVGLKARKNAEIIPLTDCPVADPGIRKALKEKTILPPPQKDRFTVYSRGGLFLSEGGNCRGMVPILDRELLLDAGVFFQSNALMLEALGADLRALAKEADAGLPMADLYCGVGTFAALLGDRFPRIDLVEADNTALSLARHNVRGEGREFFALRDDDWVKFRGRSGHRPYGFIAADPPRQGLSPALTRWIAAEGPPLFAYVSCDPATLARDSGKLVAGGYTLEELRFYDFYPQTAHIESLAVFKKNRK